MAAGDAIQIGTQFLIGFGNLSFTGYLQEEGIEENSVANEEPSLDHRNATIGVLITNPGRTFKGTFKILATVELSALKAIKKGSTISLQGPTDPSAVVWRVVSAPLKFARSFALITLDLIKEDSMTYTV